MGIKNWIFLFLLRAYVESSQKAWKALFISFSLPFFIYYVLTSTSIVVEGWKGAARRRRGNTKKRSILIYIVHHRNVLCILKLRYHKFFIISYNSHHYKLQLNNFLIFSIFSFFLYVPIIIIIMCVYISRFIKASSHVFFIMSSVLSSQEEKFCLLVFKNSFAQDSRGWNFREKIDLDMKRRGCQSIA